MAFPDVDIFQRAAYSYFMTVDVYFPHPVYQRLAFFYNFIEKIKPSIGSPF
jgi:hypothetical protein